MSIRYQSDNKTLAEIIKSSTVNASYVIPDLQRPYVWSPRQVILLVDSLFRGWPFGTLLLWEVKPDCFLVDQGIPHRPFWQVIDRVDETTSSKASSIGQPATYHMILDGQQRLQSLILALGGDQWGFRLHDSDWALDVQDRKVKSSEHWSKGSLCLDLEDFINEVKFKNNRVNKIDISKILKWVITDSTNGLSGNRATNYVYPIESVAKFPGRFIRLSRLWELVQKGFSQEEYSEILVPVLKLYEVSEPDLYLKPLSQFMKLVEDVKMNCIIHSLKIESFEVSNHWTRDDYSDAIVNIFTRLNSAGRTLSREEITLAWLKVGWEQKLTDNKSAGECLDEIKEYFKDSGFEVEMDEIVRLISFIWAVEYNQGNLLDSKDLLKGAIIRSMASSLATSWLVLKPHIELAANVMKERQLESQSSFNAVIVFITWYHLTLKKMEEKKAQVIEKDAVNKKFEEITSSFLDRWIFGSQWANVWAEGAVLHFQTFAKDLNLMSEGLSVSDDKNFFDPANKGKDELLGRVSSKAIDHVNTIQVKKRGNVREYRNLLWIWHRLNADRWKHSSIQMRIGKSKVKHEVDHTIADKWWEEFINTHMENKRNNFTGSDEEKSQLAPDGFETEVSAREFINCIGNCSLLEKSFNIIKSKKPMWNLLQNVHEFKTGITQRSDWEAALLLNSELTEPTDVQLTTIVQLLKKREELIRKDLVEFIKGTLQRQDN